MARRIEILSRDPDLTKRGYLPWRRVDITLNWLGVSSFTVDLPATPRVVDKIAPGWGVIAVLDGEQILSGSIEEPERERASDDSGEAGVGTVSITGADDLAVVAGEVAWPVPTSPLDSQGLPQDERSGPAETVLKGYVGANVGAARHANRADPAAPSVRTVAVGADLGRGESVSYSARFDPLMDLIRAAHGGLGVTCYQDGDQLLFEVVEPRDLTASVVATFENRMLRRCRWSTGMPEVTHAIVAGEGEGAARIVRSRIDSAAAETWRQHTVEFIDQRSTDSNLELDQAGDEALADGRRTGIIAAELVDTARMAYGRDYRLGDRITIAPSVDAFTDVITSVAISADADSGRVEIAPAVGWSDGPYETRQDRQLARLRRAVGALERSL